MLTLNETEKKEFLENDLYDALRWLFVGAIAWKAACEHPDRYGRLFVLGMSTSFVQALSLYEFFYQPGQRDDARARDFVRGWKERKSLLYSTYMGAGMPANKRMFHLVYKRSAHAGGLGHDGPDHIKNQAVNFAKDLRRLMELFVGGVEPIFRNSAKSALRKALDEAQRSADYYGIENPLR